VESRSFFAIYAIFLVIKWFFLQCISSHPGWYRLFVTRNMIWSRIFIHFITHLHCLECAQKFIERQHRIHKIQNIWNLKFWQLWLAIIYQGTFSFFAFSCLKTLQKIFRMDDILTTCATTQNILDSLFLKNYLFHRKLKIKQHSGSNKI